MHPRDCTCGETLPCKLRYWRTEGTMHLDPRATPSRRNGIPPRKPDPAWERGRLTDRRPGGFEMPVLGKDHQPIGVKEASENRGAIEARRRQLHNDTQPLKGS